MVVDQGLVPVLLVVGEHRLGPPDRRLDLRLPEALCRERLKLHRADDQTARELHRARDLAEPRTRDAGLVLGGGGLGARERAGTGEEDKSVEFHGRASFRE